MNWVRFCPIRNTTCCPYLFQKLQCHCVLWNVVACFYFQSHRTCLIRLLWLLHSCKESCQVNVLDYNISLFNAVEQRQKVAWKKKSTINISNLYINIILEKNVVLATARALFIDVILQKDENHFRDCLYNSDVRTTHMCTGVGPHAECLWMSDLVKGNAWLKDFPRRFFKPSYIDRVIYKYRVQWSCRSQTTLSGFKMSRDTLQMVILNVNQRERSSTHTLCRFILEVA